jgi:hypothetical protein
MGGRLALCWGALLRLFVVVVVVVVAIIVTVVPIMTVIVLSIAAHDLFGGLLGWLLGWLFLVIVIINTLSLLVVDGLVFVCIKRICNRLSL